MAVVLSPIAYLCLPLLCLASAKNVRPFIRSPSLSLSVCNINRRTSTLSPLLEPRNTCPQQHGPAYLKRLRPNRKKKLESNFSSSQSFFLCYRFCCFVCYYYCCCCNLCLVYGICVYVCVLCLGDGW
ncbi:hypothetical protein F5H01DRAFT_353008 [Linnemannia elongata]|nr:hypothetical protein F5H01DRAFT_353008 [Linnemannia elongata]